MLKNNKTTKRWLDDTYKKYNHRTFVHPDPLEFLYQYKEPFDIEIVGFVASVLAYGRVKQILLSVDKVLNLLGDSPRLFLLSVDEDFLNKKLKTFKHRFTKGEEIASLLIGLKKIIIKYGSIENAFIQGFDRKRDKTIIPALTKFCNLFYEITNNNFPFLLPSPDKKSACKRVNLFLRWMIRADSVDLGIWDNSLAPYLIVPLDTHMFKIGKSLNFTKRKTADLKSAIEITLKFKEISPKDPVKYDFAITRGGIQKNYF